MPTETLLDELERKIEERYRREKAAVEVLRKAATLDHAAISEFPTALLARKPISDESAIETACNTIVNRSKPGGYLRLSEVIQRLETEGVDLPQNGRQLRRKVRAILNRLAEEGRIRRKPGRGRGGTTYLPKKTKGTER